MVMAGLGSGGCPRQARAAGAHGAGSARSEEEEEREEEQESVSGRNGAAEERREQGGAPGHSGTRRGHGEEAAPSLPEARGAPGGCREGAEGQLRAHR